jgi:hypothetical protein
MEYILGAVVSFILMLSIVYVLRERDTAKRIKIQSRQSIMFELIKSSISFIDYEQKIVTQATKHEDRDKVRVLILENKAYWIKNNAVFEAEVLDGNFDHNQGKVVDTMGMDKVELDKLSFIVETLTEGDNNDSSNPGYKKF